MSNIHPKKSLPLGNGIEEMTVLS